MLTDEKGF